MTDRDRAAALHDAAGVHLSRDCPDCDAIAAALTAARAEERAAVLGRLTEGDVVGPVAQAIYCTATDNDPSDWAFLQVRDSGSAMEFYRQARAALAAVAALLGGP